MPAEYADLTQPAADNPSGMLLLLSYAPLSTLASIAKPSTDADATSIEDIVTIDTDHTFNTGGRFYKMELEVNKNELNSEYQGAVSGNSDKFTLSGFQSNLTPKQAAIFKKLRREKHLILVHLPDGQVLQLGQENNGAMFKNNHQTGTQEGGERGSVITVEAYHYAQFYTGAISYTAAL